MVDYPFPSSKPINTKRHVAAFDSGWLLSDMHRATGSVNFPQLLNKLETKTGQVRNLLFHRDAIENKSFKNTKANDSTLLSGPGVSFGYEDGTNTTTETTGTAPKGGAAGSIGVNVKYHNEYPDMNIFPLKALQTPITSYGGNQGRVGYREEGKCKFFIPSRGYVRNYSGFLNEQNFRQIEPQDKLIDVDRISWSFSSSDSEELPTAPANLSEAPGTDNNGPQGTSAQKAIGQFSSSGGFGFSGPAADDGYTVLSGADCKRLRLVLQANYGLQWDANTNVIDTSPPSGANPVTKTYTWDKTYSSYTGYSNTQTATLWQSTIGLAFIHMKLEIPDAAAVDNSDTAYASRASDDKARTLNDRREVYGHWTFTAPDNTLFEQEFRTSGSPGGSGYWERFDFMMLPLAEPFVLDLPFYDVEVGDTRTITVNGRKYIATFGTSTRKIGNFFSSSSGGNNTWTSRWSDGTQTETSAGQVGASWDIERVVYNGSFGVVEGVTLGIIRSGGLYNTTAYGNIGSTANSEKGIPANVPMYKFGALSGGPFFTASASSAGATSITLDDGSGDGSSVAGSMWYQTGSGSSGPDANGNGMPLFAVESSKYQFFGHAKSVDSNGTIVLQEGALFALSDNTQIFTYPYVGVTHWVQDIIDGVPELEAHEISIYEDAEWVVDTIKDYRDEYQELNCTKVRGSRHSRRLANG
tara:strand:- start:1475 stop:3559 length:2085 start_codon:yes stop_codon:yes gene_type:complete